MTKTLKWTYVVHGLLQKGKTDRTRVHRGLGHVRDHQRVKYQGVLNRKELVNNKGSQIPQSEICICRIINRFLSSPRRRLKTLNKTQRESETMRQSVQGRSTESEGLEVRD